MSSDWLELQFPEAVDFKEGPGIMARDFREEGVPLIRVAGLSGSSSVLNGCNYLDPDKVEAKWSHFKLLAGDTLLSTSASLGRVAVAGPEAEGAIPYTGIIRMRPRDSRVEPSFIPYLLRGPHFQRQAEAMGSGSVLKHFGPSHLKQMTVMLPPVEHQRRIAWVLGSLDNKIDSNRRLAALLQETVAAVFHARFTDFVGVEEFDDSEIGRIPRGWTAGSLGDIAVVHRQLLSGVSDLPYIGLDLMPRGSTILTEWRTEDAPTGQAARFEEGDILFGKLRPYFKKVGVAPIAGRCSTEILVLRPRATDYGLLLGHVASQRFIDHCVAVSRGTRMPRAEWKDAAGFAIAIPPTDASREFSEVVRRVYAMIRGLTHESRVLAEIRDALLPKLISGEIRVPDTADPDEVIGPAAEHVAA